MLRLDGKMEKANQKVRSFKAVNLVLHVSLGLSHISTCGGKSWAFVCLLFRYR